MKTIEELQAEANELRAKLIEKQEELNAKLDEATEKVNNHIFTTNEIIAAGIAIVAIIVLVVM